MVESTDALHVLLRVVTRMASHDAFAEALVGPQRTVLLQLIVAAHEPVLTMLRMQTAAGVAADTNCVAMVQAACLASRAVATGEPGEHCSILCVLILGA